MTSTPPAPCVAVAYSGGRDSSALLHATLATAEALGVRVLALHVHHGLHPNADAWLAHCAAQCRRWAARGRSLAFDARRLAGTPARGESVEAWARRERYRALREMALQHGAGLVLLAHHRQDQAETFLLQALRGAGVAGLAGMPAQVPRDDIVWARPWLGADAASVAGYVRHHRIHHVDDDSNADPRFARNRLRLSVWPSLEREFPQAAQALAGSAAWAQEARICCEALAELDLAALGSDDGLDLGRWSAMEPAARRSNALRAWLARRLGSAPAATLVERLLRELPGTAPARWTCAQGDLRRYRGRLRFSTGADRVGRGEPETSVAPRCGVHRLPGWGGRLRIRSVTNGGVMRSCLAELRLVPRSGSEQFQSAPSRPARSLKKCFQASAVPAWARAGPLVYAGERLLYVPGLGVDARSLAPAGHAQVAFEWLTDAT